MTYWPTGCHCPPGTDPSGYDTYYWLAMTFWLFLMALPAYVYDRRLLALPAYVSDCLSAIPYGFALLSLIGYESNEAMCCSVTYDLLRMV